MPSKPQRLFVKSRLGPGVTIELEPPQAHYLINVLRCKSGDEILLFNGKDGEWRGGLSGATKRRASVTLGRQTRPQVSAPDLHYLFAPLKRARLDYMSQKVSVMRMARPPPFIIFPSMTHCRTKSRLLGNAVEAAEQCGILWVPEVAEPEPLASVLDGWDEKRLLVFADEAAPIASPLAALASKTPRPLAVLIGPEGGFEPEERALLLGKPFVLPISLGPRVMRADTAAVAALALVNATIGDWRS